MEYFKQIFKAGKSYICCALKLRKVLIKWKPARDFPETFGCVGSYSTGQVQAGVYGQRLPKAQQSERPISPSLAFSILRNIFAY